LFLIRRGHAFAAAETVKNFGFDGTTAFCLSSFGLPGGKMHKDTARNGRSVTPAKPAKPE